MDWNKQRQWQAQQIGAEMLACEQRIEKMFKGETVTLLTGKYKGRKAVVDSVQYYGRLLFFIKIPHKRGNGYFWDCCDARRGYKSYELEFGKK